MDRIFLVGSADNSVRLLHLKTFEVLCLKKFAAPIVTTAGSGSQIIMSSLDGNSYVYDVEMLLKGISLEYSMDLRKHEKAVLCVRVSSCGGWLATGSRDGHLYVYKLTQHFQYQLECSFKCSTSVESIEFVRANQRDFLVAFARGSAYLQYCDL